MRVLVVEDERRIADDLAGALGRAGYVVETSADGEDAWFRGETEAFDAIVLDLGLPRMDGLSVLRKWRAAGVATPVLALTARSAWMERVEGIDAGADDYLGKPFHMPELIARVGALTRRTGGYVAPVMEVGGLRIDVQRLQATAEGRELALTPLEFRALRYLAHHRGRVVPQTELSEHVYGADR
ncbi:MAG: response regulator transcription factor, partial [Hyphomicrobiales bacterium]|nr:response regulator transcription factor [Hyphomicrobiales bacterium]